MTERRVLSSLFEVRTSKSADGSMRVGGYAARYGILSSKLPADKSGQSFFRERIKPGAFDRILRSNPDTVCLFNHDDNMVLGRTMSGTLKLRSDAKGLAFDCDMPNTSYARDLYECVKRGDMNGCSFGFNLDPEDEEWDEENTDEGRCAVRSIRNFKTLHDVSVVTTPAYPGTSVDARCHAALVELRSRLPRSKQVQPSSPLGAAFYRSQMALIDSEIAKSEAQTRRRDLLNFVLGL